MTANGPPIDDVAPPCPACGRPTPDTGQAPCLCPHCGAHICEGQVEEGTDNDLGTDRRSRSPDPDVRGGLGEAFRGQVRPRGLPEAGRERLGR